MDKPVCHGPAALVNVTGRDYLPERRATGLSNAEEEMYGYVKDVPFLLETRTPIEELGGTYSCAGPGEASVVVDGSVKIGQNPASESGRGLAAEIYRALSASIRPISSVIGSMYAHELACSGWTPFTSY